MTQLKIHRFLAAFASCHLYAQIRQKESVTGSVNLVAADPQYTFLYNATSAPLMSEYDYIIVGGGAAGCPLAATLSQNYSVLLLERGGSPYGDPMISEQINIATDLLREGPLSPSQAFTSEDGILNHRARVLGGGTCLNAGFFTHASRAFVRAAGWDEGLVHEAYLWVEGLITSFPQLGPWQTAVKNGLLEVGVTPDNGDSLEHVYGTKIGGSLFDRSGHRHTAANLLQYADPNNLRVLLFATAHRILTQTGNVFSTERLYEFQENSSLVLGVMGSMSCSCF